MTTVREMAVGLEGVLVLEKAVHDSGQEGTATESWGMVDCLGQMGHHNCHDSPDNPLAFC